MRRYEIDRLDRCALYTLLTTALMNLIIFPYHKNFLIPSELYSHFPTVIHPFWEHFPKSRNLNKLTRGIENSASTYTLPSSGQLFCFVETSEKHYDDRVPSIASTWLPKCDNGRFFTKTPLPNGTLSFSTVFRNLEDSYYDLFRKTFLGFYYSYAYISRDFDWYLKADDDNYFVMDHLKEYLSTLDPSEPLYLGYRMKPFLKDGYNSGGPGYILSNAALRIFVEHLYSDEELCPYDWAEDRGMGRCLASMGILPADTRDEKGKHRFIPFLPNELSEIPAGYHYYPLNNGSLISEKFVSLHRVSPRKMIFLHSILYPESGKRLFTPEFFELL
uniref:N-acetylgalactosaminide beta-1,3-galactosyltransferase n=1 Tax=Caenorhabditis tropicalis TaxID=1561998 RepID=A0A1I7T575_9PELO